MIDLYTARTFNGQRVSIMLEETGLAYSAYNINLAKGEQRQAGFLKLNSSGRTISAYSIDSYTALSGRKNGEIDT